MINITSSPDVGLDEIEQASSMIQKAAHADANIIWGAAFDNALKDEMRITVIATGFESFGQSYVFTDTPSAAENTFGGGKGPTGWEDDGFSALESMFNKRK